MLVAILVLLAKALKGTITVVVSVFIRLAAQLVKQKQTELGAPVEDAVEVKGGYLDLYVHRHHQYRHAQCEDELCRLGVLRERGRRWCRNGGGGGRRERRLAIAGRQHLQIHTHEARTHIHNRKARTHIRPLTDPNNPTNANKRALLCLSPSPRVSRRLPVQSQDPDGRLAIGRRPRYLLRRRCF